MFCITCTGAGKHVKPAIVATITRLCRNDGVVGKPKLVYGHQLSSNCAVRCLTTRSLLSAVANQVQGIKKRVPRRKSVITEDTGQRHGVSILTSILIDWFMYC